MAILVRSEFGGMTVLVSARVCVSSTICGRQRGLTYVFITDDLSVFHNIADRMAAFERGGVVELDETAQILIAPKHPYAVKLFGAVPVVRSKSSN